MKSRWIKTHGYCTPGGDPVWICQNCGGGMHVYGIETSRNYRDTCPDCKVRMQYPWEIDKENENE